MAKKRKKIDDEQLKTIIDHEIKNSLGFGSELFNQRRKSIDYYYGDKFGRCVRCDRMDDAIADAYFYVRG